MSWSSEHSPCWVAILHGSCSAIRAWVWLQNQSPSQSTIDLAATEPSGSFTWLSKSSYHQPQLDTDLLGSCLAVKNCSEVLSIGRSSPNLISNLANTCSTDTLEPIARSTSAALPRGERLTLFIIRASSYNPLCHTLSSSLLHCAYEDSHICPSSENIVNRGGTSVVL